VRHFFEIYNVYGVDIIKDNSVDSSRYAIAPKKRNNYCDMPAGLGSLEVP
jgi:hypothetical protein